jgi:hypothetical protein
VVVGCVVEDERTGEGARLCQQVLVDAVHREVVLTWLQRLGGVDVRGRGLQAHSRRHVERGASGKFVVFRGGNRERVAGGEVRVGGTDRAHHGHVDRVAPLSAAGRGFCAHGLVIGTRRWGEGQRANAARWGVGVGQPS